MKRIFIQTSVILLVMLLSLGINPFIPSETMKFRSVSAQTESHNIVIQEVNLEVKKGGKYFILEELVSDEPGTGEELLTPQIVNKSNIRINASYSTLLHNTEKIIIHSFSVEVYEVLTGETDNFTSVVGSSQYRHTEPAELTLKPNSSKSEVLEINSLLLPTFTTYKFVFYVEYHIFERSLIPERTYFAQNMSFELVENLPEPPYVIVVIFYVLVLALIAFVILGVYGNFKFKDIEFY
ncbi:MAG: hypothetical protein ACXACP_02070 [Candidatus Hodarchaeales archaeon]